MDKTPKTKSSRFVRPNENKSTSTPSPMKVAKKQRFWNHDEDNQETNDVLWDWDSPKNIRPKALRVKRREIYKSPILSTKKTSQTDHMKNYEKLKLELQALRDEIARTDDCLPLSPVDEQIFREENADSEINSFIEEQYFHIENQELEAGFKTGIKQNTKECIKEPIDELFNDDCDEQLFLCTQMIEEKLGGMKESTEYNYEKEKMCQSNRNDINENIKVAVNYNSPEEKLNLKSIYDNVPNEKNNVMIRSIDDSFDNVLLEFEDEHLEILSQTDKTNASVLNKFQSKSTSNTNFKRTISDANVQYTVKQSEKLDFNKSSFHRTQSFDSPTPQKINGKVFICTYRKFLYFILKKSALDCNLIIIENLY